MRNLIRRSAVPRRRGRGAVVLAAAMVLASCALELPAAADARSGESPSTVQPLIDTTDAKAWEPLGGVMAEGPAVAAWSAGRLDVFVRGTDDQLWHKSYENGWSVWEPLGGVLTSAPAVAAWSAGRLDVFVRGTDNHLWHKSYQNGWSVWEPLGGVLTSAPAVAARSAGQLDVFVRGSDNQLWHKSYQNGWSVWEPLGGVLTSAPAVAAWSAGRLDVFVRGTDDQLWHKSYENGWSVWEPLGGVLTSAPAVAAWSAGRLDVFVRGTDNQLWTKWYENGWSGWTPLGGVVTSDPAVAARSAGQLDVFVRGSDDQLWHKSYDDGWSPPPPSSVPVCGSVASTEASGWTATVEENGRLRAVELNATNEVEKRAEVDVLERRGKDVIDVDREVPVSATAAADDPYYAQGGAGAPPYGEWGIAWVKADATWSATSGTPGQSAGNAVVVAVIDTGVQGDHSGLAGRVLAGKDYIVPDLDGRIDPNGHGTHVAGIIAENDDSSGGVGVAPRASILPVRVLGCNGSGTSTNVANGIYWAIDHGAKVLNLSVGTSAPSDTMRIAVETAVARNVVVVAAAGNNGVAGAACTTPTGAAANEVPATAPPVTMSATTAPATPTTVAPSTTTTASPPTTSAVPSTTSTTASAAESGAPVAGASATPTTVAPSTTTTAPPPPATVPSTSSPVIELAPRPTVPPTVPTVDLEAVAPLACPLPGPSSPSYPAGFAPGRRGVLAVAATGGLTQLQAPASPFTTGPLSWKKNVGDFVAKDEVVATVNAQNVRSPLAGFLTAQLLAGGATVNAGDSFAQLFSGDLRASYSNVNDYVSIAGPGGGTPSGSSTTKPDRLGIWSTIPGGYGYKSGTSMATPHVAGVAALLRAKCPSMTAGDVTDRLKSTATDLGPAGNDTGYGAGMVNALAAVVGAC